MNSNFPQVVKNRLFFFLIVTAVQPLPVQSKHSLSKLFDTENNLDCFGFSLSVIILRVQVSGQGHLEMRNAVSPQCAWMSFDL